MGSGHGRKQGRAWWSAGVLGGGVWSAGMLGGGVLGGDVASGGGVDGGGDAAPALTPICGWPHPGGYSNLPQGQSHRLRRLWRRAGVLGGGVLGGGDAAPGGGVDGGVDAAHARLPAVQGQRRGVREGR